MERISFQSSSSCSSGRSSKNDKTAGTCSSHSFSWAVYLEIFRANPFKVADTSGKMVNTSRLNPPLTTASANTMPRVRQIAGQKRRTAGGKCFFPQCRSGTSGSDTSGFKTNAMHSPISSGSKSPTIPSSAFQKSEIFQRKKKNKIAENTISKIDRIVFLSRIIPNSFFQNHPSVSPDSET